MISFLKTSFKGLLGGFALFGAVAVAGCVETIENDYDHSSSVYGESDNSVWEKIDEAAQGG